MKNPKQLNSVIKLYNNKKVVYKILCFTIMLFLFCFIVFSISIKQTNTSLTVYTFGKQEWNYNDSELDSSFTSFERGYRTLDPYNVKVAVDNFKKEYPDVQVNVVEFDNGSSDAASVYKRFTTELMAGKGPDVIIGNNIMCMEKDISKLVSSGVFAPLDDFIADDEKFNKYSYYTPVMNQGFYRGKRYLLPLRFSVPVMMSGEKALEKAGFNVENLKRDYLGYMQEINRFALKNAENANLLFTQSTSLKEQLYYMDFVAANGITNKNTLEMKQLFEIYKPISQIEFTGATTWDLEEQLIDYGHLLVPTLNDPFVISKSIQRIQTFDSPVLIPLRKPDGGINAVVDLFGAIRNSSPNQQNAYNFIRMLIGPNAEFYHEDGLTPNKEVMNALVRSVYYNINDPTTRRVPPKYENEYLSFLDDIDNAYFLSPLDKEMSSIMNQYLLGERSYEECITAIQNKVSIYATE